MFDAETRCCWHFFFCSFRAQSGQYGWFTGHRELPTMAPVNHQPDLRHTNYSFNFNLLHGFTPQSLSEYRSQKIGTVLSSSARRDSAQSSLSACSLGAGLVFHMKHGPSEAQNVGNSTCFRNLTCTCDGTRSMRSRWLTVLKF